MSHKDFLNNMYQQYRKDQNNWVSKKYVVKTAFEKYYNNHESHFELLRLIVYNLDAGKYNEKYLNFLESLLFTLLEENAISLIYKENENPSIYFNPGLNKILSKYPDIFLDNELLTLSNTQIVLFIKKLQENLKQEKEKQKSPQKSPQKTRETKKYNKRAEKKTKKMLKKKLKKLKKYKKRLKKSNQSKKPKKK
tara:strand:- start:942 stop:1523 length:582 start_codon:yes stop_codon:yes gene_type:complete